MSKIKQIVSREILNSKAVPTIETMVVLEDGSVGVASCPGGTSIGGYEATELRDRDAARYQGLGMLKAIHNVEKTIAPELTGKEAHNLAEIDKRLIELDATVNKANLGANTMLSVSMATAKAAAKSAALPLYLYLRQFQKKDLPIKIPTPIFNIVNGGEHAGNNLDFQEYMLIPATSKTFSAGLEMVVSIYKALKNTLSENNLSTLLGDEGGFGPTLSTNADALAIMRQATDKTNFKFGYDVFFGIDAASNSYYKNHRYSLKDKNNMSFTTKDLISYYQDLNKQYSLLYLEDPFSEDDWDGWQELCKAMSSHTLVVGDDLTATNPYRLQMAIAKSAVSGVIIKPNQIGTVIESLAVVEVVREAGLKIIVSNRSGETNDDFIADFAIATGADYVKFGGPARGERVAKYNRLLHIEHQIKALQAKE